MPLEKYEGDWETSEEDLSKMSYNNQMKNRIRQDLWTVSNEPWKLGMSDAEKESALDLVTGAAKSAIGTQQGELARAQLSGGANVGHFAQVSRGLADKSNDLIARHSADINKINEDRIARRRVEIAEAADKQREISKQNTENALNWIFAGAAWGGAALTGGTLTPLAVAATANASGASPETVAALTEHTKDAMNKRAVEQSVEEQVEKLVETQPTDTLTI